MKQRSNVHLVRTELSRLSPVTACLTDASLVALLILRPSAVADGDVEGRIADTTGKIVLDSVQVRIDDIELEAFTDERGQFSFEDLAAEDYTATVDYIGPVSKSISFTVEDGSTTELDIKIGEDVELIDKMIVY